MSRGRLEEPMEHSATETRLQEPRRPLVQINVGRHARRLLPFAPIAWVSAVIAIALALFVNRSALSSRAMDGIAAVKSSNGAVFVRGDGLVSWREAVSHQVIGDSDWVATGPGARARIALGLGGGAGSGKKLLVLGSNTQIRIMPLRSGATVSTYIVEFARGQLMIDGPESGGCADCPGVNVNGGADRPFVVPGGTRAGYMRLAGTPATEFDVDKPWPTMAGAAAVTRDASDSVPADPTGQPGEPGVVSTGNEVTLRVTGGELRFWTLRPLAMIGNSQLDVPVNVPATKVLPPGTTWRGAIEVSSDETGKAEAFVGNATNGDVMKVPVSRVRKVTAAVGDGPRREYVFSLRGGFEAGAAGVKGATAFAGAKIPARIISVGEVASGPVYVAMDQWKPALDTTPWMEPKADLDLDTAPFIVRLTAKADYRRLLFLIRGATKLNIAPAKPLEDVGVFVVRRRGIVAQVDGLNIDASSARTVLEALGGEVAFRGERTAFREIVTTDMVAFANSCFEAVKGGKTLYLYQDGGLVPVGANDLKMASDIWRYVTGKTRAIFDQQVEILAKLAPRAAATAAPAADSGE